MEMEKPVDPTAQMTPPQVALAIPEPTAAAPTRLMVATVTSKDPKRVAAG